MKHESRDAKVHPYAIRRELVEPRTPAEVLGEAVIRHGAKVDVGDAKGPVPPDALLDALERHGYRVVPL